MSKRLFIVNNPGIYASIQDLGRYGYQQYGVPVSGAMDKFALQVANLLVGNKRGAACLEVTMGSTSLEATTDHFIAITGANLDVMVDGKRAPLWRSFWIRKGQQLMFKGPVQGVRAYLAIAGGFETPHILGSQSVYERGKIGRSLKKGEVLHGAVCALSSEVKGLGYREQPTYKKEITLRIIASQHAEKFETYSVDTFYQTTYVVNRGDRMGYMLSGSEDLRFKDKADIISEAVMYGTVQVPSNGKPIILMADSQTTGGYAIIGNIIKADLWKIAQLPQGGKINFQEVSIEEAVATDREQERLLGELEVASKLFLK